MAKASITTLPTPPADEPRPGGMPLTIDKTRIELTDTDTRNLLSDAFIWRCHARGAHRLAEMMAENTLGSVVDAETQRAIVATLGAARIISELAEAALERACDLLDFDYDGTAPDNPERRRA